MKKDPDGFRYEWKVESFLSEEDLLYYIQNMESKGWKVHTLEITEKKVVLKKSKMERLDD
jgi:hypothetical protein